MLKKITAVFISVSMIFSLVACGKEKIPSNSTENQSSTVQSNNEDLKQSSTDASKGQYSNESQKETSKQQAVNESPKDTGEKPIHNHSFSKASCTTPAKCSCGETKGTALGHKYIDFKCTACGAVEPDTEIERLKKYILDNGETKGSFTQISWYDQYNTNFISYDANEDVVYFAYAETLDNDEIVYAEIVLNKNFRHKFYCDYAKQSEMRGYINAKSFTANSPLGCDDYSGDSSNRETFINDTRLIIIYLIKAVKAQLTQMNAGVTIKDLGFSNF